MAIDLYTDYCDLNLSRILCVSLILDVRGPQDTPYAEGTFKLDVEVTPRYPFEPPRVKFLTRIHHPNIDSGGRICLDTLNMPPKGSWNPSSNLCSVLITIQQLMCEPNPDDGLSAEVTKEFIANRAAFNLRAKEMTRQYAMSSPSPSSTTSTNQPEKTRTNETTVNDSTSPINTAALESTTTVTPPASSTTPPMVDITSTSATGKRPLVETDFQATTTDAESATKKQRIIDPTTEQS